MDEKQIFDSLLREVQVPWFYPASLHLEQEKIPDIGQYLKSQLEHSDSMKTVRCGDTVALAVGSREIAHLPIIVRTLVEDIQNRGGIPFVVPSMGSHGGATAKGQEEILRHYGITKEACGASVRSSMETVCVGLTEDGREVHIDKLASQADHIIPVARIKPHTDFRGQVESGLMKMLAIGLGKQQGASVCHKLGFPTMGANIINFGKVILEKTHVLAGIGIIENASHEIRYLEVIPGNEIMKREPELLKLAKSWMPKIPFGNLDVLLVNEIGKEISGAGMDPNITGRSCVLGRFWPDAEKIAVLDLTDKSDGNGAGMGNADAITKHMFRKINLTPVYINGLTCRDTEGIRIPAIMETDLLALKFCLHTCIRRDATKHARIVWIKNTADISVMYLSEALGEEAKQIPQIRILGEKQPLVEREGRLCGF